MSENGKTETILKDVYDVVVVGGGQAALSLGFYLRRSGLDYIILDFQEKAGGSWLHSWDSLRLFSPAQWSSLPGWLFPGNPSRYPHRDEVISYLEQYEERYQLPIVRPVDVQLIKKEQEKFELTTSAGDISARAVICATGSWHKPFIPDYPRREVFRGFQIHSANYQSPERFVGKRVLVVGEGNSGAQILAEVSKISETTWVTLDEPQFLPDEVDGRVLFDAASEKYRALTSGISDKPKSRNLLGSIVMVKPVKEARERRALGSRRPFREFTQNGVIWNDDSEENIDAVIWCTGFQPALDFLKPLNVLLDNGKVEVGKTRSVKEPQLWLVGYGNWTGFASATLIGVGRSARVTVEELVESLKTK